MRVVAIGFAGSLRAAVVLALILLPAASRGDAAVPPRAPRPSAAVNAAAYAQRITTNNMLGVTITNFGFLGNNFVTRGSSLEYPLGSGYEHLASGGLWVGAQAVDGAGAFVGVTTGCVDITQGSASSGATEFTPIGSSVSVRSTIPASPYFSPLAVSEQDFIAEYDDLTPVTAAGNPETHRPLGIQVRQECFSWTLSSYQHLLFLHFVIRNLGSPLANAWVGLRTELASGSKNAYSCWPPSSSCGPGSWFSKKWVQWDDSLRLIREHYCAGQPVPAGCNLNAVPYWIGVQLLTPPDTLLGQKVTLAAWSWAPGSPFRDQDGERYGLMSAGTIQSLAGDSLQPGTGDPVELLALGPFASIATGDSVTVDFALVGGASVSEIQDHARLSQRAHDMDYADPVVATLGALVSAEASPGAVRLEWHRPGAEGASVTVERREPRGAWRAMGEAESEASGRIRFTDLEVVPGRRYGYRVASGGSGTDAAFGEVWIDVPLAPAFALHGLRPNPSSGGDWNVALALRGGEPATLELLDLAGRRLSFRRIESSVGGNLVIRLGCVTPLPPGVYVARLLQGARSATVKGIVVR